MEPNFNMRSRYTSAVDPEAAEFAASAVGAYYDTVPRAAWRERYGDYHGAELLVMEAGVAPEEDGIAHLISEAPSGDYLASTVRWEQGEQTTLFNSFTGGVGTLAALMEMRVHFADTGVEVCQFRNPPDECHPEGWCPTTLFEERGTEWKDPTRGYTLVLTGGADPFSLKDPEDTVVGAFPCPAMAEVWATAHAEGLKLALDRVPALG